MELSFERKAFKPLSLNKPLFVHFNTPNVWSIFLSASVVVADHGADAFLHTAEISIAIPAVTSLTFVFTAITGFLLGERDCNTPSNTCIKCTPYACSDSKFFPLRYQFALFSYYI